MRKYMLVFLVVLSLLIAGCGSNKAGNNAGTIPGSSASSNSGSPGAVQEAPGTQAGTPSNNVIVTTLSAEEQALAENKLKTGEKVAVSTSMKYMNVGDVYTFAVGVKNIYPQSNNFRLKPVLDDAKSPGLANLIHTDDMIESWLARNNFETFQINAAESKIVPLIIEVGKDISTSSETVPGSYTFNVVVEYESSPRFWDKYNTGEDPLVIKIK